MSTTRPGQSSDSLRDVPDLVPARMLNEFAYCPRLAYLEWVQGEFADSVDTVEGRLSHSQVDEAVPQRVPEASELTGQSLHARSVWLSGIESGLTARIDLLELEGQAATPVDYKRGRVPSIPERIWEPEQVQLCAQGLILREHGFDCTRGVVYYAESNTRVELQFDETLVSKTLTLVEELRRTVLAGQIPAPLVDSPKCPRCSLVGICLPDETNLLAEDSTTKAGGVRRLASARDDAAGLYVQEQGAQIRKHGDVLEVRRSRELLAEVRLIDLSQVSVFGNVQVSTQALKELSARNIPVAYFTYGGWLYAFVHGTAHKNVELRIRQYQAALHPESSVRLARRFVAGKVRNCRTLLRRNHGAPPQEVLTELSKLAKKASSARSPARLLGLEGAAARLYFGNFSGMLKASHAFDFTARNRRPPRDPVNAVLSFVYALLVRDLAATLFRIGFDPLLGFYHRPRYGRPALALDLAEEFRPIVGDSVTITVLNGGEVRESDFLHRAGAVSLSPRGRRQVISAYERRMDSLIIHPIFGYSVSYRRILELQARLLARYLLGEIANYPAFTTR